MNCFKLKLSLFLYYFLETHLGGMYESVFDQIMVLITGLVLSVSKPVIIIYRAQCIAIDILNMVINASQAYKQVNKCQLLEVFEGVDQHCGCLCLFAKALGHQHPQWWSNTCCSRAFAKMIAFLPSTMHS